MEKKNLIFIIESFHLGGAEKSLVTLLQNLDYNVYNVDLILFKEGGIFEKYIPTQVNIIQKSFSKVTLLDRIKFKIMRLANFGKYHSSQLLWRIIENRFEFYPQKYDSAIAYSQGFATYFTNKYIQATKKFCWINIDYQKAGYNIDFDFTIYRNFNKIVAVSPEVKISLKKELSKIHSNLVIEIIKDITDKEIILQQSEELLPQKFNPEKINILTVGRLAKQKGLFLAIESCKKLIDKGYAIHWYVVGEGTERKYLEDLIKLNQIDDSFFLIGATDNPYPYMKTCDIYVQTSLFEGLGLTVIEASYLNKPIVSTNFPSVYGILIPEKTGLIAEMNANSISAKIEALINNKALRKTLIQNLSIQKNNDKELSLEKFNILMVS